MFKKLGFCLLLLFSLSAAALRVQGQVSELGYGAGAGLSVPVIPVLLDIGWEGMLYQTPQISSKGSFTDNQTGNLVNYDGKVSLSSTRTGLFFKITSPLIDKTPLIGFLLSPTIHCGTQRMNIGVDGTIRMLDANGVLGQSLVAEGSYVLVGFPSFWGPFFIEPAIGAQHIAIKGVGQFPNTPAAQLAVGLSFF